MMKNIHRKSERGATALFIVIFSILLMSTITISFMSLMVKEQQRSTNDELSQSAYDSALAGVEDAKRAIVASKGSGVIAEQAKNAIAASQLPNGCQEIGKQVNSIAAAVNEIPIQSSTSKEGAELNQAYTCLKVNNLTDNFQAFVEEDSVTMVPLRMAGQINQLRISWQRAREVPNTSYSSGVSTPLLTHSNWHQLNYPAMLRLQTITPERNFSLDDFDDERTSSSIFLYPAETGATTSSGVAMPQRAGSMSTPNKPEPVTCISGSGLAVAENLNSFLCSVTIDLNRSVQPASDISYLVIKPLYRETSVQIEGLMNGRLVQFDGAQPTVDSTGRANDLFRRVEARLTLGGEGESGSSLSGVIPQYALDVDGSICKNFFVSSTTSGVFGAPACSP